MKKPVIFLLLTLFSTGIFAQNASQTIRNAEKLINEKKYETAFRLLDKADHDNKNPDIVLLKEKILLNYFVISIMHRIFALKDIGKNEDIMQYRGKNGNYDMISFPVDSILKNLIRQHPENCRLYKGLADYYYDVLMRYQGQNGLSPEELFKGMEENAQKAVDKHCADAHTYFILAYSKFLQEKYKESIPYFEKYLEQKKDDPDAYYNLAVAYYSVGEPGKAMGPAKKSLEMFKDSVKQSDAARLIGWMYADKKDTEKALKYFETADKKDPGNLYNLTAILSVYLATNNPKAKQKLREIFALDPGNPTVLQALMSTYQQAGKIDELIDYFEKQLKKYEDNPKVEGSLAFHLGGYYLYSDKNKARKYLIKAKQNLSKVFPKDHQVFQVIDRALQQLGD